MDLAAVLTSPLAPERYLFTKAHPEVAEEEAPVRGLLFLLYHHLGEEGVAWGRRLLKELPPGKESLTTRRRVAFHRLLPEALPENYWPHAPKLLEEEELFRRTLSTPTREERARQKAKTLYQELGISYLDVGNLILLTLLRLLGEEGLAFVPLVQEEAGHLSLREWKALLERLEEEVREPKAYPPSWWLPLLLPREATPAA